MRRYDEPMRKGIKYTRRPGVYAVIALGRDLLLTHQELIVSEIQLPGGGIDAGESPVRALHREVFEETGFRVSVQRRLGAYQRYTFIPEYDMWAHKICHIYLCRPARQICDPPEPDHTVFWMDALDAQSVLTNRGDVDFVAQVFGRR